jgi:hypothetical protein
MVKNENIKSIISMSLMFVLVVGCFATIAPAVSATEEVEVPKVSITPVTRLQMLGKKGGTPYGEMLMDFEFKWSNGRVATASPNVELLFPKVGVGPVVNRVSLVIYDNSDYLYSTPFYVTIDFYATFNVVNQSGKQGSVIIDSGFTVQSCEISLYKN